MLLDTPAIDEAFRAHQNEPGEVRVGSRSDLHLLAEDDLSAARRCGIPVPEQVAAYQLIAAQLTERLPSP